jgi:N,N'-diacetyllegionaminate synthase
VTQNNVSKALTVAGIKIGADEPCFIIAEAGVNHGGDMHVARQLVDVAVEAQANAVKFQAFKTENLILKNIEKANYQKQTTESSESQYNMLKRLEISIAETTELKKYCDSRGIIFLTTPFDEGSLDELDDLNLPAYKVASTDTTNIGFLRKVAQKNKPVFLSTGMSYFSEVERAVKDIQRFNQSLVVLQCTANYPTDDSEANLRVLDTFRENLGVLIGYSDHTMGVGASPYAVAMGACVVEKHFTLDPANEGPDHRASLSPEGLKEYVKTIRRVESYLGSKLKAPTDSELETRNSLQKCLVASRSIKKGEVFSDDNIVAKRTGGVGISPMELDSLLGLIASRDYQMNEIIQR